MARFNLSSKIAFLIAGLLVGLGAIMLATFSVLSTRQVARTIEADATSAGKQLSLYLDERMSDLDKQAHHAATGDNQIKALVIDTDKKTVQNEIPILASHFSVDAIQIVSDKGNVLGQSPGLGADGYLTKARAQQVIDSGRGRTTVFEAGSHIYLMSCFPVRSGEFVRGAIVLLDDLGLDQARLIAQRSGDEIGFTIGSRVVASSLNTSILVPFRFAMAVEQSIHGEPYVAIAEPLPAAEASDQLGMVILRKTSAIAQPYVEARNAFVSILALSLFLSIVGGIAFGKGIVEPISTLADAARVVQSGHWPELFEVQRKDEIGVLQSSFNDMILASKSAQERLLAMIDLDPLTELLNHRSFRERLSQEARRSEASETKMSLTLVDLDSFGDFNESRGRGEGDRTLRQVGAMICECVPEFTIVARYAGDQFAALLPGVDAETLSTIMNYVRVRLQQAGCPVTISVGCSEFPKNSSREDGLILAAELALTRAEQLGQNRVCLFDAVPGADKATDPFLLYQSLENGSFATIQALAAAVDAKDTYTNGHSERVAEYAQLLSAAVGDTPEMVDRVFRCGTLHDVGKIGVPDAILKKPGRLDPDEQRIMETHPVLGELIAGKVPQLADLLPGVRNHHERWDGRGYPDRLAGEHIPYVARILALADSYDAMTSDRPYRKGLSVDIAIAEIQKASGTQFDPKMAEAFVRLVQTSPRFKHNLL